MKPTSRLRSEWLRDSVPRPSLAERDRRWAGTRRRLAEADLAALLVYGSSGLSDARMANLHYLSLIGGNGEEGWLLFPTAHDPLAFVWSSEFLLREWHERGCWIDDVRPGRKWSASLASAITDSGLARERVGVVGLSGAEDPEGSIPHDTYAALLEALPHADFVNASALMEAQRRVKSPEEQEFVREAAKLSDLACLTLEESGRTGRNEADVYADVVATLLRAGAEQPMFLLWDSGPDVVH
ncbi:MAG: aminopeptidase P family N-terminal domain-containing protein, partial [Chloroflexi bacterium]|nr:aminopeptidase P family N-terminal domain-containing protein [Chloroflexota bacterium]